MTQLYASIDGSTKAELKAIDRPLHRDFWERFQASLKNMKNVCARTVYRLTLVAGFNLSDVEGYADLVAIAEPDFIEVKGVTYCGTSNNAELRYIPLIYSNTRIFVQKLTITLQKN